MWADAIRGLPGINKKVGENLQIPPEQIDQCGLLLDKVFQNRRFVLYKVLDQILSALASLFYKKGILAHLQDNGILDNPH